MYRVTWATLQIIKWAATGWQPWQDENTSFSSDQILLLHSALCKLAVSEEMQWQEEEEEEAATAATETEEDKA